jgi:hypothetical protein
MARRRINPIGLSFLDAITCGFGATILFYMIINASTGLRAGQLTADLRGEVDRLENEVLEGYQDLVELRNTVAEIDQRTVIARGLSARVIASIESIQAELATYDQSTLARREHVERLKADLKSLEEDARRLSAAAPSEETPGDRLRDFVGDGDRQYLTGLKVGGERIFILVDASASMLDETIVNIIRRRNLPESVRIQSDKWQQALSTVDWLTTQIPRASLFQIYTFNVEAGPVIPDSGGEWLSGGDRERLDAAVDHLRRVVPRNGTSLYHGLAALRDMRLPPDNLILLVDSLPTQGESEGRKRTVSGKQRLKLFERAVELLRPGIPVNVILFPMEGDPMAASSYWKLAMQSGGSFLSPPEDWP